MPLRLAKFAHDVAVVVDVHPGSLNITEHFPNHPSNTWHGQLRILGSRQIEITVGPYRFVGSEGTAPGHFRGTETLPDGSKDMDIILLRTEPDVLFQEPEGEWLCFADGWFTPSRFDGSRSHDLEPRLRGVSSLLPIGDGIFSGQGFYGGEQWDGKWQRWPTRTSPNPTLRIDYAVPGPKYQWGYGESQEFTPDISACCYRSNRGDPRVLYPLAQGQDLVAALKNHR